MAFRNYSVSTLVIIALVTVTTLLLGFFGAGYYAYDRHRQLGTLRTELAVNAEQLATGLANPLWDYDDQQIGVMIEGMMHNRNIFAISVISPGRTQVRQRDAQWRSVAGDLETDVAGLLFEKRDIYRDSRVIGTVRVFATTRFIEEALRETLMLILTMILLVDVILILSLYALIWIIVLRPVRAIERYAVHLRAGGGAGGGIGGTGFHGELDLLRASIESMVNLLDARYVEIRQTSRELQESREFLGKIVENIPDMILLKDAVDLRVVKINRAGEELLGYSRDELLGRSDDDFFPKDAADFFKLRDREVLSSGQMVDIPEQTIQTRQRGERILHTKKIPLSDGDGKPQYLLDISEDITDRRRDEEQKRVLEERLQRAEKMEALGTLAGGVAHDLNNVLGIVVGYAELLLDAMDDPGQLRPALLHIMDGGERAAAIVQDLLTLSRRGVPVRKVLNLNRIVTDVQKGPEAAKLLSLHPAVQVVTDLEPDLLNVAGSPVHLGKSLFNLLANGCEAMPHGGVVTVRTANRYIDRPVQGYDEIREGDYVVLTVTDTGSGIPAADLPRIFEPFYTKKVMGRSGTGLGLAVVWGTVKDHHGYIHVQSEEGRGSTFSLYFPVTREEMTGDQAALPLSAYMGRGEEILVVDDVKGQRDLAVAMLQKLNYSVTSVAGGEEALAWLRERQVDLMVLDMIMDPGIDGLETYRRALALRPGQKAIIVSGFSEMERVSEALALGAGSYVRKPYVLEKLGLAVRSELDRTGTRKG